MKLNSFSLCLFKLQITCSVLLLNCLSWSFSFLISQVFQFCSDLERGFYLWILYILHFSSRVNFKLNWARQYVFRATALISLPVFIFRTSQNWKRESIGCWTVCCHLCFIYMSWTYFSHYPDNWEVVIQDIEIFLELNQDDSLIKALCWRCHSCCSSFWSESS